MREGGVEGRRALGEAGANRLGEGAGIVRDAATLGVPEARAVGLSDSLVVPVSMCVSRCFGGGGLF